MPVAQRWEEKKCAMSRAADDACRASDGEQEKWRIESRHEDDEEAQPMREIRRKKWRHE